MDAETAELLTRTLDHVVISAPPGRALLDALDELGWRELGSDAEARRLLFEAQGRSLAASPALDGVMAAELAGVLPGGVELAEVGVLHAVPGLDAASTPAAVVEPGGAIRVTGLTLAGGLDASTLVVAVRAAGGTALAVIGKADGLLATRSIAGLDPDLGLVAVEGSVDASTVGVELCDGPAVAAAWERAVGAGRRALAHELVGVSARMLELAVEHARTRVQFSRPIGSFQAVQHRLADCHVAVEAARAISYQSWESPDPVAGALAKAVAGRAAREGARHCQQVLGGIGFTWEHPLHRYIRRGLVLDLLLGSVRQLEADLGARLLADRAVPKLVELS